MKYFYNPKSLSILIALSLTMWGYLVLLSSFADPRLADSSLEYAEMYKWELPLLAISLFALFYLWICSVVDCYKHSNKAVGVFVAILWPLTYFYSLHVLYHSLRNRTNRL